MRVSYLKWYDSFGSLILKINNLKTKKSVHDDHQSDTLIKQSSHNKLNGKGISKKKKTYFF